MARLNEPPVPIDGSDILRKKLLRQNRDLAKSNAGLAMRIRMLEQEKQQLINQKLELAGRVLDLEQKIERNVTQRIADQALEIRAKLEAQLSDCMNLLSDLGQEPPRKRRQPSSPRSARASRLRMRIQHRSPPRRRPVESERDAELRALSEGRLVPIFEAQHVSRQTLNPEQIQALCSAAGDSSNLTDSPELGPPPMSRFVDAGADGLMPPSPNGSPSPIRNQESPAKDEQPLPSPAASPTKTTMTEDAKPEMREDEPTTLQSEPETPSTVAVGPLRTSSKRKFANNDTNVQDTGIFVPEKPQARITASIRGERKNKTLKELTTLRREARAKQASPPTETRKPLSSKSTNENLESPKKTSKPPAPVSPPRALTVKGKGRKIAPKTQGHVPDTVLISVSLEPPTLSDQVPAVISEECAPRPTEAAPPSPSSPTPTPSAPRAHDTPPPADISAMGETARPSRRSRASVSYAEPNLRDKMRRPTKELFDAVTGDGRFKSRHSTSRLDEVVTVSTPRPCELDVTECALVSTLGDSQTSENLGPRSPLVQKARDGPYCKGSTTLMSAKEGATENFIKMPADTQIKPKAISPPVAPGVAATDPYDFTSSSPNSNGGGVPSEDMRPVRRQSKSSRRLSSVARDDFQLETSEAKQKSKPAAGKKRASNSHGRLEREHSDVGNADMPGNADRGEQQPARTTGRRRSTMV